LGSSRFGKFLFKGEPDFREFASRVAMVASQATHVISVDRSKGDKLGVTYEPTTLEISGMKPSGLVASWNAAHPEAPVKPGDRILEVNGKSFEKLGAAPLQAEIATTQNLSISLARPTPTTFVLHIEKPEDEKLGMSFEMGTLSVNSISPGGLVAAWNLAHPDKSVQPNDQIVAVNGKHISTHGTAILHEALKRDKLLEITVARAYFAIRIDKQPGQKIGALFHQDSLKIKMIETRGLLAEWNRTHPDTAVRPGDRVIEVNGKQTAQRQAAELSAEMRQERVLRIRLAREAAAAGAVPSNDQDTTFTVQLDKANGGKLGLVFEVGTLKIDAIQENGLVPSWNHANPACVVRLNDQIVEVNGRHLTTHGPEQLQNTIYEEQNLTLTIARASTYTVLLQRLGDQKLGLKFDPDTLKVSSLDSAGLVAAWNARVPGQAVELGDRIMEVNQRNVCDHGTAHLAEELRSAKVLRVVMARRLRVLPPGTAM